MNYFTLLARLLLITYSIFLILLTIGEGISGGGWIHIVQPVFILLVVAILWNNPLWSAIATFVIFLSSLWFFKTYEQIGVFLIVSVPLAIATILYSIGSKVKDMV